MSKTVKADKTEADVSTRLEFLKAAARGLCGHAKGDTNSVTGGFTERKYL
jgi:hypothetical protein